MEDEYFVGNGGRFAAVFDGHGGSGVSAYLKNTLYETVNDFLQQKHWEVDEIRNDSNSNDSSSPVSGGAIDSKDVVKTIQDDKEYLLENAAMPSVASHVAALRAGFEKIERDVIEDDGLAYQGSTAVAIVLH
jgi:serine/threonine protein phosphatase PrpC